MPRLAAPGRALLVRCRLRGFRSNGRIEEKHPQGLKPAFFAALLARPNSLVKNLPEGVEFPKTFPQGLKPSLIMRTLTARVNSCPFKTAGGNEFFTELQSRASDEDLSPGALASGALVTNQIFEARSANLRRLGCSSAEKGTDSYSASFWAREARSKSLVVRPPASWVTRARRTRL